MTDDLVAFLRARLAEDKEAALFAGGRDQRQWAADLSGVDPIGMPSWPAVVRYTTGGRMRGAVAHLPVTNERSEDRMTHIARHDPARVLREVEAKRGVIREAFRHAAKVDGEWGCCHDAEQIERGECEDNPPSELPILRLLAAAYADHSDFQPRWASELG